MCSSSEGRSAVVSRTLASENAAQYLRRQWRFDAQVANIFEDHVRKSVPFYDEIHRMNAEMSDWFIQDSSLVYDLGTSVGEGINRLHSRHSDKKPRFVAVDASHEMVERAKTKLAHVPNVQFIIADLNKPFSISDASYVMLVLTMQFLNPETRPFLLREIHKGLREGGGVVLVEKVTATTPEFDEMWIELHHGFKRRCGLTDDDIIGKQISLRGVMVPFSAEENLQLLREAGFTTVEVFFKWYNWLGILAVK